MPETSNPQHAQLSTGAVCASQRYYLCQRGMYVTPYDPLEKKRIGFGMCFYRTTVCSFPEGCSRQTARVPLFTSAARVSSVRMGTSVSMLRATRDPVSQGPPNKSPSPCRLSACLIPWGDTPTSFVLREEFPAPVFSWGGGADEGRRRVYAKSPY